jgi:hypothetical protein
MDRIVIRLNSKGGQIDIEILPSTASNEDIDRAVKELVDRCTFAVGDTITITEE